MTGTTKLFSTHYSDMAVYAVTGDFGSGKSLITVGLMRDYGAANKRIATNMKHQPAKPLAGYQ